MKTIGIKLADGSFYPVLEDNIPSEKELELTTAHNNQTKIMVDLYRSANCTMEDAEYVDSLQIENLVAHPNGEPDIKFNISLDENNQLSARILDSETGNESNTTITLVSRTLEERLVTDEYNINDTKDEEDNAKAAITGAAAAGGLLAAAAALRNENSAAEEETNIEINDEPEAEEPVFEETSVAETEVEPAVEETPAEAEDFSDMNLDLPDDAPATDEAPAETVDFSDMSLDLPDDAPATDETPAESEDFSDMSLDLPDDAPATDETPAEAEDFSDMRLDLPDDAPATDETPAEAEDFSDMSLDLPDDVASDETLNSDETISSDDTIIEENNSLPDMDFDIPEETNENDELPDMDFDIPDDSTKAEEDATESDDFSSISLDLPDDTSENNNFDDMDFDLPDGTSDDENPVMPDDFFNTEEDMNAPAFDSETPATAGLNFDGLYDEETERGTPAQTDEDDVKKKTKVPVIICIICAIICIIATALILFIIPSKYNLITKKNVKESVAVEIKETNPQPEPIEKVEPNPEPTVPEAKEDDIVIIEKAEEVVPKQPPVAEEKPKNITYKIKWGDTLWDIADTYYKNPWRYKYIARYNGIKNPDYIISGTKIIIPAE